MATMTVFAEEPKQPHHAVAGSQAPMREDARLPEADPLSLDPYSPIFPTHAPEWNDPDPRALNPYSPIFPARAPR